jgi:hypothetical protein
VSLPLICSRSLYSYTSEPVLLLVTIFEEIELFFDKYVNLGS